MTTHGRSANTHGGANLNTDEWPGTTVSPVSAGASRPSGLQAREVGSSVIPVRHSATAPTPPVVALFKQVFARLGPDSVMPLDRLYAPDVVFEDPLHRLVGRDAVAAYFARLNARVESAEFAFTGEVLGTGTAAMTWTMTVRTRRPRKVIVVPGVSVLVFDDLVTAQRDYFDVGAMLYEQLPGVGWLLRWVKRQVG